MRVQIDMSKCEAYGLCAEHASAVFELDEWGYARLIGDGSVADEQQEQARQAAASCPVRAIQVGP
jgi:ferredoxin